MSEEMKLRKEKLFSQAKNGYDRISERIWRPWRPTARCTEILLIPARRSGNVRCAPCSWPMRGALCPIAAGWS